MRILLYGGCHAQVIRDYLQAVLPGKVDCTLLVNFELIRTATPFPYADLSGYDVVIFSPIENKAEYNTEHLVAACKSAGVQAICFPWLEWHGYCPGATKGVFKDRFQWHYPDLIAKAAAFDGTFDAFCDEVTATFPHDDMIDACLESSTAHLRGSEQRHEMAVTASDFILDHFQTTRLFLISDHPSRLCYQHVFAQILPLIGIDPRDIPIHLASIPQGEPQWRWRTPILPKVARRLGLAFDDAIWFDDEVVPARQLDLRTYLALYFFPDSVILGPKHDAPIFVRNADGDHPEGETIGAATRLFASRLRSADGTAREEYRLLRALSDETVPIVSHQRFEIDPDQWRSTWLF